MTVFNIPAIRKLSLLSGCAFAFGLLFVGCSEPASSESVPPPVEAPAAQNDLMALLAEYETEMNALVELLRESDDVSAIEASTRDLVALAVPILTGFAEVHPDCRSYLRASQDVVDAMELISVEEIEANYHLDGALPEGSSKCYHVKDLLVHPATVIVMLREGGLEQNREDMTHEIVENQAHLNAVRASLE